MPTPAGLFHRLADHAKSLDRDLAVRINVVRRVEIERIDVVALDEAVEVDRLRRLDPERLQLVIGDDDILVPLIFEALDHVAALDRLAGLGVDQLLLHAVAGFGVELVQADVLRLARRRGQIDRARHQRETQKSVPSSARHERPPPAP